MKILDIAKKSKALKDSAMMMVGNTFASGIAAIALIIFSRFLGPEKFGIFSIGFSMVLLLSRLSDGGINIAIPKFVAQTFESSKKTARQYISGSLRIKSILSLLVLLTFFILAKPLSTYWLKTEHYQIVRLAVLLTFPTALYEFISIIHQSVRKFSNVILMNVFQAMSKAVLALGILAFQITDPFVAFTVYTLSPLVGVAYGLFKLPKWIKLSFKKVDPKITSKILSFMKFTSIAIIAGSIGDNIDVLIVKSYLTEYHTGLYSAGSRLAILVSMLGYSMGSVLAPRVARYKDVNHFASYAKKAMLISLLAIISIVFILPLTKILIIITAGKQYLEATGAVRFLLSAGMVTVATTPFVSMFYVLEKPAYFAVTGIIQTATLIAANIILIPKVGILGAGQAKLIMRILNLVFTLLYANYAIKYTHKKSLFNLLTNR